MRIYILYIYIVFLLLYAWKDWFKSLCGLILLMVVIQRPDVPSSMFGIQGFNPWNVLFLGIVLAWVANRRREGLMWDMPRHISVLLLMYLAVILVGFLWAALDKTHIESLPFRYLVSDQLINTIKWVLPGILLFDGCRTRKRVVLGLCSVLGIYVLTAALILRNVGLGSARSLVTLSASRGAVDRTVGYGAVTMAMMMAGAAWAILGALPLVKKRWHKVMVVCGFFLITCALILTGGRMGYITWTMLGLIFGILRFRRCLLLFPVAIMLVMVALPGVSERMLEGFGGTNLAGETSMDDYAVSSGRLRAWPYVIDKIAESPIIGYGRLAMVRTGLQNYVEENMIASAFSHPHNAYLEILLDAGLIGFLIVVSFFTLVVTRAYQLLRDHSDPLFTATGTITLALVLGFLIAGIGAQHFYPREANMGMWLSIFLTFRVSLERSRVHAAVRNDLTACWMPATVPSLPQPPLGWRIS